MKGPLWIDPLERRLGWLSMPGPAAFIVGMNAAVWGLTLFRPEYPLLLTLEPELLTRGQAWRAVTFLFIPPAMAPLWMFFWLYLLYTYATTLEQEWGDFRFNLFYGIGAAATVAASLALGQGLSNMTLNATLFLAFAALYPDFELLLFFVLPVRVKWLAWLAWAGMLWGFAAGNAQARLGLASGLLNYALFFGPGHWEDFLFLARRWRGRRGG